MLELTLEDNIVRFTPDGRVAVVDAIGALSASDCPACVWEDLKRNHPGITDLCSDYTFADESAVAVAESDAWDQIQGLLLDHILDLPDGP